MPQLLDLGLKTCFFKDNSFGTNTINGSNNSGIKDLSGGSMILNLLLMVIGAFLVVKLVKFLTRSQS